jgi:Xaa-Pro aminopeptidase
LIVVDSGAEYDYLAADITRTFPSNGKFAPMQRRAYEVVLRAQEKAIAAAVPGATIDDVHMVAVRELCAGLLDLGILDGSMQSVLESDAYKKYYMHRTSHWLGMDVHDVGVYHRDGKPRPLVAGMVLTVEPGLYFAADDPAVPDGLKDVGIRIEDDILVTDQGPVNLSVGIAKTVEDIEREMAVGPEPVEPR